MVDSENLSHFSTAKSNEAFARDYTSEEVEGVPFEKAFAGILSKIEGISRRPWSLAYNAELASIA